MKTALDRGRKDGSHSVTLMIIIQDLLMGMALNSGILKSSDSILPIFVARDGPAGKIKHWLELV